MREFNVALVTYIVEHDERVRYDDANSLVIETPLFRAILAQDRLQFLLKEDFDDPGAAADAVRPFVEAWVGKARDEHPEDGFRLEFEEAQIMVLRPEPRTPQAVEEERAVETGTILPEGGTRASYPQPPAWGDLPARWSPYQRSGSEGKSPPRRLPFPAPVGSAPVAAGVDFPPSDALGGGASGVGYWGGDSYWGSPGPGVDGTASGSELAETVAQAVTVLEEIRDALNGRDAKALEAQIGEARSSTAGIGHNNPPPELDEARAIVRQGLEALTEETPSVERLLTVRAALEWLGARFTTFADALASSLGKAAKPALLLYVATELPKAVELFERLISLLR